MAQRTYSYGTKSAAKRRESAHLLSLLESVRDAVVGRGLLSERELTDLSDALRTPS